MTPPRLARWLLTRLAPSHLRDLFVGDLDEAFGRERARRGDAGAARWYRRQLLTGITTLVRLRLRRVLPGPLPMGAWTGTLRLGWRRLIAAPGFAASAAGTLTCAFAAWLTVFAFVQGVLLSPLEYHDPGRLVDVGHRTPGLGVPRAGMSQGAWFVYQRESRSFDALGIYNQNVVNLTDRGLEAEQVPISMVSHDVFTSLGVRPLLGRFSAADDGPSAPPDVILSHDLWTRRYGADAGIIGRTIEVNGNPRRVLGVMPNGFAFPTAKTALWMRQGFDASKPRFGELIYGGVGRLKPGVSAAAAETELNVFVARFSEQYSDVRPAWVAESGLAARVESLHAVMVGDVSTGLWLVLGAASLVLLLAGANVTNLFLIRTEQRRREVGICRAIGASHWHIFLSLLAEAALVTMAAALVAAVMARAALSWLTTQAAGFVPRAETLSLGPAAVVGLTVVALVTMMALAGASLLAIRRVNLRDAGRQPSPTRGQQHVRRALTSVQVGLAFAVIVAASLLVRSFWNLTQQPLGFSPAQVLTFEVSLPFRGYETFGKAAAFHHDLLSRVRALPGVKSAGAVTDLPLSGFTLKRFLDSLVFVERPDQSPAEAHGVRWKLATPGYFDVMGIPVLRGRWFDPGDHFDQGFPIVVSETFARRYLGPDPIGRRLRHYADPNWWTVVGVVGDVKDASVRESDSLAAYVPVLDQQKASPFVAGDMSFAVRSSLPATDLAATIRGLLDEVAPRLPMAELRTMETTVARAVARDQLLLALVGVAAGLATLVGLLGLYGALSYRITQRRREFGVRLALGASVRDLYRRVGSDAALTLAIGLGLGSLIAVTLGRGLSSLLFGVQATDMATFAAAGVLLAALTALTVVTAWRRLRSITPLEALASD